jgi:hypothetical protein
VVLQLARSGGTLIGRCLGAMRGVTLLSEVNPRGQSHSLTFNPLWQGERWFKLVSPEEAEALMKSGASFQEVIAALHKGAAEKGSQLVIRDWTHIDYFAWPIADPPYRLSLLEALAGQFSISTCYIVRHPLAQWMSWCRYTDNNPIRLEDFMDGCYRFAVKAAESGFIKYEDFCEAPDDTLKSICNKLQLDFDPSYKDGWYAYYPITGDTSNIHRHYEIRKAPPLNAPQWLRQKVAAIEAYGKCLELLGYTESGPDRAQRTPTGSKARPSTSQSTIERYAQCQPGIPPVDNITGAKDTLRSAGPSPFKLRRRQIRHRMAQANNVVRRSLFWGTLRQRGRVLILDPSLIDKRGHHHAFAQYLKAEAETLGLYVKILGNTAATREIRRAGTVPFFPDSGYSSLFEESEHTNLRVTMECSGRFLNRLSKIRAQWFKRDDFVFFPGVTPNQILAIAQWMTAMDPAVSPRFGLCLMFQPNWDVAGGISTVNPALYDSAFTLLRAQHGKKVVYSCETEGLAKEFEVLAGKPPVVLPVPTQVDGVRAGSRQTSKTNGTEPLRVAFLGVTKHEKGAHLLPDIVEIVSRSAAHIAFDIQVSGDDIDLNRALAERLSPLSNVALFQEELSSSAFQDLIVGADILLLPYDPTTYRTRGSGLITEARKTAIPVVVPLDTDLGRIAVGAGFGVGFKAFTAESVATALIGAVENIDRLRCAAEQEAENLSLAKPYLATLLAEV